MQKILGFVRSLDPKLTYSIATFLLTYTVQKLAIPLDPILEGYISAVIAAAVGYRVGNDGTVLRTEQEDGNAYPPDDEVKPKRKPTTRKKAA